MQNRWQIAVNTPLNRFFTYEFDESLEPGTSVKIPFGKGNREVNGLVVEPIAKEGEDEYEVKKIISIHEERPPLKESYLQWLKWISDYYIYPLGQIQQLVFPPLKKESKRKSRKAPIVPQVEKIIPPELTEEQKQVLSEAKLDSFQAHLLHGVTGSGKTEVYIEMIEQVLESGKTAMVLVPEISLTPQLVRRFAERFPDDIAVLHSHLTEREKTDQWWLAYEGKKRLLIGARSALFCPVPNLGIIIIDEEHETSFKQEEKLKYNARDTAIMRGFHQNFPVILGSATPSLETWQNAQSGKYKLLTMKSRVSKRPLPSVDIVNLRDNYQKSEDLPYWLSKPLFEKLKINFDNKQQSALFLNRRGVAPSVQCYSCGFIYMCPNCDISLTLHGKHHLVCHYCNYSETMSADCPECKEGETKTYGLGTEAIENDLLNLFPEANIFRADRDEINSREAIEEMVEKMESGEIDFLVGTQMIAKGLDFKNLTLVGIVQADIAFNIPDFRASERSFQLNTQVSGRAGRHSLPGEVIIQTYKPDHPSLLAAQNHDYVQFVNQEVQNRELFNYPPYGKLTTIRLSGLREHEVLDEGQKIVQYIQQLVEKYPQLEGVQVLGPTPAPLTRIKNRYRYHILIKSKDHQVIKLVGHRVS
ncbi:MAG: primosomal protein N', partial [Bdellovibrionales bacterium]|nr:primosomal protein N' [Bdellovibrionales bacterium]